MVENVPVSGAGQDPDGDRRGFADHSCPLICNPGQFNSAGDSDVDGDDIELLFDCLSGANQPADPACLP